MLALITGASSGLGADMARVLARRGYNLILVARRKEKLEKLKKELEHPKKGFGIEAEIISMDLASTFNCMKLYNKVKKQDIDIVINNAGFGLFGEFTSTKLEKELDMIDLNIKSVQALTKQFLKDFKEKDKGYILNVASSAGFMSGPYMATYYATKAYVLHFTEALNEELRRAGSKVYIGALCPGPVDTNFNKVAGVKFAIDGLESYEVAEYAIEKMLKRKLIIIPGFKMKCAIIGTRFLSRKRVTHIAGNFQKKKEGRNG
ncbi:MAG: SDR family oxidoreductase [Bacilli bacterium]|nr:SDR family oxidoreductase [Bacilli bacterium]